MNAPARAGAVPDAVWIPGPDPGVDVSGLPAERLPESFWRALRWFSGSRLVVAGVLAGLAWLSRSTPVFSFEDITLFGPVAFAYLVIAMLFLALIGAFRPYFYGQLVVQVVVDLAVFTALVWAAGGVRSGLGVLMVATVAGAATVSTPRLAAAFAAAATLLLLGETALRMADSTRFDPEVLTQAALLGTACFVTALAVSWLAARLHMQEDLARRRGEELRSQIAITRQVMAEIDRGIIVAGPDGEIRAINRAAQAMFGIDSTAWRKARSMRVDDLARGPWGGFLGALERARSGATKAISFVVEDGSGEAAQVRRFGLRLLGGGNAAHGDSLIVLEDLQMVEERAQQLKLASMGRLSASIAHEIRNPLGAIRHANGLLAETVSLASQSRLVRIVEDNTLRINRIVEDVLSISRRDRAMEEPIDVRAFLARFLAAYAGDSGDDQGTRIAVSVTSARPLLFDENHLQQVLANLLGNAMRHASQERAAIRIEWRDRDERGAELRVSDDGPGMSKAALTHIFEPFFTTESRGTGLGLFLTRELCRANHATIHYEAKEGDSRYRGAFVVARPEPGEREEESR